MSKTDRGGLEEKGFMNFVNSFQPSSSPMRSPIKDRTGRNKGKGRELMDGQAAPSLFDMSQNVAPITSTPFSMGPPPEAMRMDFDDPNDDHLGGRGKSQGQQDLVNEEADVSMDGTVMPGTDRRELRSLPIIWREEVRQ